MPEGAETMNDQVINDMKIKVSPPSKQGGFRDFELLETYDYGDGTPPIPVSFRWNGASSFIGRQRGLFSSCGHDRDYDRIIEIILQNGWRKSWAKVRPLKKVADRELLKHMISHDRQHRVIAWIFYIGVRLGGWCAVWNGVRKMKKQRSEQ